MGTIPYQFVQKLKRGSFLFIQVWICVIEQGQWLQNSGDDFHMWTESVFSGEYLDKADNSCASLIWDADILLLYFQFILIVFYAYII